MTFYTDGSAHPNPGPGGYGVVGIENDTVSFARSKQYRGPVTNNEMEWKAILYQMNETEIDELLNYARYLRWKHSQVL